MNKQAKVILRAIKEHAKENRSYYTILKTYWPHGDSGQKLAEDMGCTDEIWQDVYRLSRRYDRFKHYIREIEPEWKIIDTVVYGDNSIEVKQINKYGGTRRGMVKAPSGDLCY